MNYKHFYKQAEDETSEPSSEKTWKDTVNGVQGYQNHIPMLALLTATGALGGRVLSNKQNRLRRTLTGAASLPLAYLAYIAARRNNDDDIVDRGFNWVNDKGNELINSAKAWWSKDSGTEAGGAN